MNLLTLVMCLAPSCDTVFGLSPGRGLGNPGHWDLDTGGRVWQQAAVQADPCRPVQGRLLSYDRHRECHHRHHFPRLLRSLHAVQVYHGIGEEGFIFIFFRNVDCM